jgi:hypothetical protein
MELAISLTSQTLNQTTKIFSNPSSLNTLPGIRTNVCAFALLVEPLLKRFHGCFPLSQVERTYAMIAVTKSGLKPIPRQ